MEVQSESVVNEKLGLTHDQKYLVLGDVKIPFRDHVIDIMQPIKDLPIAQQRAICIHGGVAMPEGLSDDQVYKRALHVVQKAFLEATLTQGVSLETAVADRDTVSHLNELQYINIKNRLENHTARVNQYERENAALVEKAMTPKPPKPAKAPKAPEEPKAPKAAKPEMTGSAFKFTSSMVYALEHEPSAEQLTWIGQNIHRKNVYETVVENPGLTIAQLIPLFATRSGSALRAADGGKNQTNYRLKEELVPSGIIKAIQVDAPVPVASPVEPPAA
jgi:hypothetical protein